MFACTRISVGSVISVSTNDEGHYGSGGGWGAAAKNIAFFLYYGPLLQDISPLRPSPLPVPLLSSPVLLNVKSFYCPHKL